jgi:hypothetical protein
MPWREDSMVTNGERKTNNFGKLVRQKVGLFSKVGSARAVRAAGGAPVVVVRLPPSKMRAESNGVRADSEAMHSETRARKQATSTVPLSTRVNARSTVPGREANKLNVDDVES